MFVAQSSVKTVFVAWSPVKAVCVAQSSLSSVKAVYGSAVCGSAQ